MSDDINDVIRDLAGTHGHKDLSEAGVKEVRSALSNNFLDDMLDSSGNTSTEEKSHDDGKTECS